MATTLKELLAQRAALEQQIIDAQREERGAAIAQVRDLMSQYGLTLADIGATAPRRPAPAPNGAKVAAKYRDPDTGATWSGRGLQPRWLREALAGGRSLADFAV